MKYYSCSMCFGRRRGGARILNTFVHVMNLPLPFDIIEEKKDIFVEQMKVAYLFNIILICVLFYNSKRTMHFLSGRGTYYIILNGLQLIEWKM